MSMDNDEYDISKYIIPLKDDPDTWIETLEENQRDSEWEQWTAEVSQKQQLEQWINQSNIVLH